MRHHGVVLNQVLGELYLYWQRYKLFQITNLMQQLFYFSTICVLTLRSSTCFEQHPAHPQEDKLYHHNLWYRHPGNR